MSRHEFRLPDLGEGTVDAEIVAWHVEPGDRVEMDQPVVDLMTNKATLEITAPVAGRVVERHGNPGDVLPVGTTLLVFEDGSDSPRREAVIAAGDRILASPAVRRMARELGIDLERVHGSGPDGRILKEDLQPSHKEHAVEVGKNDQESKVFETSLIGLRRRIAEQVLQGHNIPTFAYVEEIDVTQLEALRRQLNNTRQVGQPELTYLPLIILALVKTLRLHPMFNAHYDAAAMLIRQYGDIHVGIATHTGAGLKVPVLRNAQTLDLWACARELRRLAAAARDNTARPEELTGSTISITSLGKLGGLAVIPIINSPEVAILGINQAEERPVVRDNAIVIRRMMNISSCFDHRVSDGQDAAEMIQCLKGLLENPAAIFI